MNHEGELYLRHHVKDKYIIIAKRIIAKASISHEPISICKKYNVYILCEEKNHRFHQIIYFGKEPILRMETWIDTILRSEYIQLIPFDKHVSKLLDKLLPIIAWSWLDNHMESHIDCEWREDYFSQSKSWNNTEGA